jgi:hypothetical protein
MVQPCITPGAASALGASTSWPPTLLQPGRCPTALVPPFVVQVVAHAYAIAGGKCPARPCIALACSTDAVVHRRVRTYASALV